MAAKINFIVERSGITKIVRQPQLREQMDTLSVSPSDARQIDLLLASTGLGINRSADTHGLKKFRAVGLDGFGFNLKAFSRPVASQQSAVIGDMRHDFNLAFIVIPQKFWRRKYVVRCRRGKARECSP